MKIKNIAASILTVTAIALTGITTATQTVSAASVSVDTSSVIYISNANGAQLYTLPSQNGSMVATSQRLSDQSGWQTNKTINIDGSVYYQVAENTWVAASDTTDQAPAVAVNKDMYVQANGGVNIYDAPNGNYTGSVNGGDKVYASESKIDQNGTTWYNIGNGWIKSDFLSNDNVKETLTMSATAYDPVVLGSDMGYSGVAANLSKFPKGTHLRITDSNGKVYDRVVNDTGLFAYSNPNQLDIAMPNSEALQFGRQNITVQVLG